MKQLTIGLVSLLLFVGCATMSKFDQNSLDSATRIKKASGELIAHATEPAATYKDQITSLQSDLSAQLAYEKGKGAQNEMTYKQWDTLAGGQHLLGKLLSDWAAGKTYTKTYVTEESSLINDAFDQIINLEGAKIR
jgi:hypothetical protein